MGLQGSAQGAGMGRSGGTWPGRLLAALAGLVLSLLAVDSALAAPAAPVVMAPTNGSTTSSATPTFSGTAETSSTVTVIIDGAMAGTTTASAGGSWSFTTAGLSDGPHTVTATATDPIGNQSPSSAPVGFTVDTTAPAAPVVTAPTNGSTTSATPTFSGTAETSSTVTVTIDGAAAGTATASAGGSWSFAGSAALSQGTHSVSATAADAAGNTSPSSATITFTVGQIATTLSLAASSPSSAFGQTATFIATLAGAMAPTGTVAFLDGSTPLGSVTLTAGQTVATLDISTLGIGPHAITATYSGDPTHAGSASSPLTHTVRAVGSIVIRQETDGIDAVFGFSSPTSALNLSVATSGGRGESAAVSLPAGGYAITADDMTEAGFGLTGLACSDGDSSVDLPSRTANIALDAGEVLICTFTSLNSAAKTTQLIDDFQTTRASLILANQPDTQHRIDRLNGVAASGGNPVSSLMGYLPGIVDGSPLAVSTSLAAIDRLAGNEQPNRFDMWIEGTFAVFDAKGPNGTFNAASLGADYLITPDLLIGGFVQVDHLSQSSTLDPATISGTGWMAGPYATARLSDNLYFDILAAAGTSSNKVSPYGTYEDGFDATRWLLSASLEGQWQWDNWTFSPRARASYFQETTNAYTDSLGVGIPAITAGLGQIAVGPAISYRYTTEGNVVIDTGLRLEGVAGILNTATASGFANLHGRIEGTLDFSLPGGASVGLSAAYDGIGSNTRSATSAKIRINLPLD